MDHRHDGSGRGRQRARAPMQPPPSWRWSIEDPFDLTHDLGRPLDELGQVAIDWELVRAGDVLRRTLSVAGADDLMSQQRLAASLEQLWAPATEADALRIEEWYRQQQR
jgi:hypothetical protein